MTADKGQGTGTPVPDDVDAAADVDITPQRMRAALGRFATGVAIVTCIDDSGARFGLTVSSFNALSLQPPLVLWSLRAQSPSRPAFETATHFAVNVLAQDQLALSRRFASPLPDKFDAGTWAPGLGGAPLLHGAAAIFECERQDALPLGDHTLFVGRVRRVSDAAMPPLTYHAGHYHALGPRL